MQMFEEIQYIMVQLIIIQVTIVNIHGTKNFKFILEVR
jgi:hypothetical protein